MMIVTYLLNSSTLPDPMQQESVLSGLPKERVEKIRRQKHPDVRRQSFAAGLLLQHVLQQDAELSYSYGPYGKPFAAKVPFNLSHSAGCAILSVLYGADGGEADDICIGCDIEMIKKYDLKVARRFFTEAEYRHLNNIADSSMQAELFFRYWTRKESVLKLTGLGMALPMDLFDISAGDRVVAEREKIAAWCVAVRQKGHMEDLQAAHILLDMPLYLKEYRYGSHCITVCSSFDQFAHEISMINFDDKF